MKKTLVILTALFFSTGIWAQTSEWTFDHAHSSIEFSIDHMVISEVTGKFTEFDGKVTSSSNDFENAQIEFFIEAKSINTDNEDRDNHLRDADFFDVAKFPQIVFKSTSFAKIDDKNYLLSGELTMHGVTKAVTFDVKYGGTVIDPWGNTKAGFKLTGELNRKDYGLTWSKALETGGLVVGEEVTLTARVQLAEVNN